MVSTHCDVIPDVAIDREFVPGFIVAAYFGVVLNVVDGDCACTFVFALGQNVADVSIHNDRGIAVIGGIRFRQAVDVAVNVEEGFAHALGYGFRVAFDIAVNVDSGIGDGFGFHVNIAKHLVFVRVLCAAGCLQIGVVIVPAAAVTFALGLRLFADGGPNIGSVYGVHIHIAADRAFDVEVLLAIDGGVPFQVPFNVSVGVKGGRAIMCGGHIHIFYHVAVEGGLGISLIGDVHRRVVVDVARNCHICKARRTGGVDFHTAVCAVFMLVLDFCITAE